MHNYIQNEQLSYIYSMFFYYRKCIFPYLFKKYFGLLGSTYNSSIN